MKKVLLTATVQSHIAQFHKPLINMLKENGYEVHVAARDNLAEKNGLKLDESDKIFNIPFDRSPLSRNNIIAYQELKKILSENQYDIVHCNTPMGGVVTRLAAKKYRKKGIKVFYTAHGFHFYKGAPKKNWIIYYPIEKFLSRYTDKLITITKEDFNLAKDNFRTDVVHIHGVGVNTEKFFPYKEDEILRVRNELGYGLNDFVLICIGELNKNKNQNTVVKAISELANVIPNIKLLLAGNGPMEHELRSLVKQLDLSDRIIFLGYTTELQKYINISDALVTASYREGLPLNVMEAMLCSKPIIASYNRGHIELVKQNVNGFLYKANDIRKLKDSISQLYNNIKLRNQFGKNGHEIISSYTSDSVVKELKEIYNFEYL